jgi:hypothetical protein
MKRMFRDDNLDKIEEVYKNLSSHIKEVGDVSNEVLEEEQVASIDKISDLIGDYIRIFRSINRKKTEFQELVARADETVNVTKALESFDKAANNISKLIDELKGVGEKLGFDEEEEDEQ